jgi:hypothetical protein
MNNIDRLGFVVGFDLAATDHPIATLDVRTAAGVIKIMAEVAGRGRQLELTGMHIESDIGPNALGAVRLRSLAKALGDVRCRRCRG